MSTRDRIVTTMLCAGVFIGAVLACGGGNNTSSQIADLDAAARFTGLQFVVENKSAQAWRNVKLDVNGGTFSSGFVYQFDHLPAGETATIGALQFANSDGKRFNPTEFKPQKLVITATLPNGQTGVYVGEWK